MDVAQSADMVSFWFYFPTRYASHGIIHVTLKDLILCFLHFTEGSSQIQSQEEFSSRVKLR